MIKPSTLRSIKNINPNIILISWSLDDMYASHNRSLYYKNGLNFNILLMKFPIEVMEYVIVHELAHIKHKNHSKDFWNLVAVYCSNYKEVEKLFKNFL